MYDYNEENPRGMRPVKTTLGETVKKGYLATRVHSDNTPLRAHGASPRSDMVTAFPVGDVPGTAAAHQVCGSVFSGDVSFLPTYLHRGS